MINSTNGSKPLTNKKLRNKTENIINGPVKTTSML